MVGARIPLSAQFKLPISLLELLHFFYLGSQICVQHKSHLQRSHTAALLARWHSLWNEIVIFPPCLPAVLIKYTIFVRECLVLCLVLSSPSGLVNSTNCRWGWAGLAVALAKTLQCSKCETRTIWSKELDKSGFLLQSMSWVVSIYCAHWSKL